MAERRRYVSTVREQRALETRRSILGAAFEMFVAHGYVATSIRNVAERAGVSDQRIYQAFGNKRELFRQALEAAIVGNRPDAENDVTSRMWQEVDLEPDAVRRAEIVAAGAAVIAPRVASLIRVEKEALIADPEFKETFDAIIRQRLADMERIIPLLSGPGSIAASTENAAATLLILLNPETYEYLVESLGWSTDRYQEWLADTLVRSLGMR